ncbi:urotensin II-related peptide [Sander lucioperca]|uniref:urotensin II-related peptide n=1 Tax=Sander lucioperca TaxID=283035 RepID=UPI0016539439|nr:urotensin II-related peptide [Sander lucioperca]
MVNRAALVSVMKVLVMMLIVLGMGVKAAPTERGFVKPAPSLTGAPTLPEKSSALNLLKHLKLKVAGEEPTTRITEKTPSRTLAAPRPDNRSQMLKMISALEDLHRTMNSTLSARITIMPRANGRNSGRKNKVLPATPAPAAADSTVSRASADVFIPSLTGRNFRKSLPPQTKKTNKRVCFWKYCSQN